MKRYSSTDIGDEFFDLFTSTDQNITGYNGQFPSELSVHSVSTNSVNAENKLHQKPLFAGLQEPSALQIEELQSVAGTSTSCQMQLEHFSKSAVNTSSLLGSSSTGQNVIYDQSNKSIFPWSFQSPAEYIIPQNNQHLKTDTDSMKETPDRSFVKIESETTSCSSVLQGHPLMNTINSSLSSIPRNSSLANALNDFDRAYEQVKRKNEECDRMHGLKQLKSNAHSKSNVGECDTLHGMESTSSFRALLNEDVNDTSVTFPPLDNDFDSHGLVFTASSRISSYSTSEAPLQLPTATANFDQDLDALLGELQSDGSTNHWTTSLVHNSTTVHSRSAMSSSKLLQQLLTSAPRSNSNSFAKVQDTSCNVSSNISTCPACNKEKNPVSNVFSHSLCDNCIKHIEKVEEFKKNVTLDSGGTPCSPSSQTKQEGVTKNQEPSCVVAHLVAINSSTSESIFPSTVPLYVVIEGKAIPLTIAQVQSSPVNSEKNQSDSKQTSSQCGSNTSSTSKNIKISPMPLPPNPGSCLMIAGIAPGVPAQEQISTKKIAKPAADDPQRIYGCTYPNCNKRYFKASHLKAHIR